MNLTNFETALVLYTSAFNLTSKAKTLQGCQYRPAIFLKTTDKTRINPKTPFLGNRGNRTLSEQIFFIFLLCCREFLYVSFILFNFFYLTSFTFLPSFLTMMCFTAFTFKLNFTFRLKLQFKCLNVICAFVA